MVAFSADPRLSSITGVTAVRERLSDYIVETPVMHLTGPAISSLFGAGTELYLKMETFQPTGSFKVRSVLAFLQSLGPDALRPGLVTMSAGNHAAAVAYAARCLNTSATVVMPKREALPLFWPAPCHSLASNTIAVPAGPAAGTVATR